MATPYYTKRFLTGLLKGLSVNTSITFDSARIGQVTKRIHTGAKGSDCITGSKWIVTDASFQNYAR